MYQLTFNKKNFEIVKNKELDFKDFEKLKRLEVKAEDENGIFKAELFEIEDYKTIEKLLNHLVSDYSSEEDEKETSEILNEKTDIKSTEDMKEKPETTKVLNEKLETAKDLNEKPEIKTEDIKPTENLKNEDIKPTENFKN